MKSKYGMFTVNELAEYKDKLHNKLFWLLLYKDPQTKDDFTYVDFDSYFVALMKELNGLNEVLIDPHGLVEMISILEAAYMESKKDSFNYKVYRKFVLDAHNLLDRIDWEKEAE